MNENPLHFGEYLKMVRLGKKLSVVNAAKKLGMKPQKLSDIESGRRYTKRISFDLIQKLSQVYQISVADLSKHLSAAVNTERTAMDILQELIPAARMTELLADRFVTLAPQYSVELTGLSAELAKYARDTRVLLMLMQRNHFRALDKIPLIGELGEMEQKS